MVEGEEFKALADLLSPDGSNNGFAVLDPSRPDGLRPVTLADRYGDVARLELPDSVPKEVRGYFDAARMLWTFGWFYFPFYTWATLHAGVCAELGLKHRFANEAPKLSKRRSSFEEMLKEAVKRGWLTADEFTRLKWRKEKTAKWTEMLRATGLPVPEPSGAPEDLQEVVLGYLDNFRQLRNGHAHPDGFFYALPGSGLTSLEVTRDLLVQLYPSTSRSQVI